MLFLLFILSYGRGLTDSILLNSFSGAYRRLFNYYPSAARCLPLITNRIIYLLIYMAQFTKSQSPHFPEEILLSIQKWYLVQFIDTDLLNSCRKYFTRSIFSQLPKVVKKKKKKSLRSGFENGQEPVEFKQKTNLAPWTKATPIVTICAMYRSCHYMQLNIAVAATDQNSFLMTFFHKSHLQVVTYNWLNLGYLPSFQLAGCRKKKITILGWHGKKMLSLLRGSHCEKLPPK